MPNRFVLIGCSNIGDSNDVHKEDRWIIENQWSKEEANAWYRKQGWIVGCNFIPSNAINQLEMWQEDTFSPEVIDKELGWAEDLGFNTMRVYLHSLVYQIDPEAFKARVDEYLTISAGHGVKTILVFFDDCWQPEAKIGKQPEVKIGVHNSGWVHDPIVSKREDTLTLYPEMEKYVTDVMTTFKEDDRVLMWDLYNEPGNSGQLVKSLPLLKKIFTWAREVNPLQPITTGIWNLDFHALNEFSLDNSDIITYHHYHNRELHQEWVKFLELHERPLICTEWMARHFDSTFEKVMSYLKEEHIGAISWGFVAGKTNTIFAWSDPRPDGKEPELWFHDVLRANRTPYSQKEVDIIKSLTLD